MQLKTKYTEEHYFFNALNKQKNIDILATSWFDEWMNGIAKGTICVRINYLRYQLLRRGRKFLLSYLYQW